MKGLIKYPKKKNVKKDSDLENKIELYMKRNKTLKIISAASLSLFIGTLGLTCFHKNKDTNLNNKRPVIEQRLEVYDNILLVDDYEDKDRLIEQIASGSGKVPILMYHKIGGPENRYTVSPKRFKSHLEKLYDNDFQLISLEDYVNKNFEGLKDNKKPVVITFDDADKGQFEYATYKGKLVYDEYGNQIMDPDCAVGIMLDFYKKHPNFGLEATFFIDFAGEKQGYNAPFLQEEFVKMKLNQLLALGLDIGGHTYSHKALGKCSLEEIKKELEKTRRAFNYYLGSRADNVVNSFAYPYGSIPKDKEKRALIDSYYSITTAAWGGTAEDPNSKSFSTKEVPRIEISTNLEAYVIDKKNIFQKKPRRGD